jgi:acetoacetyl-CoA synthetase
MQEVKQGSLLWEPAPEVIESTNLTHYMRWLAARRGLHFITYTELWRWSVTDIQAFWESLWDYFGLRHSQKWTTVLESRQMPGARWFPGTRLNFAENIFALRTPDRPMMLYQSEWQPLTTLSWAEVYEQVGRLAAALRRMGVGEGDRVAAFLPNTPEAMIAILAAASLGAIWSSCSPDFGERSVLDRFAQIEPKVLIAVDGYQYNGKRFDRRPVLRALQLALPTVERTILIPHMGLGVGDLLNTTMWEEALDGGGPAGELEFAQLPFDHPLWILYSSGTTGLPKPIVHGHGGILLELVKSTFFHNDLKPGDRFFWYTSTGWMMWNYLLGSLLSGASIILYNGSPGYPNLHVLFELAERSGMTYFGTSAAFISACLKAGICPNERYDLSRIRGLGSTGSPLTPEGFAWVYDCINRELALESLSGGTDLCTAFVGGARINPIYAGEIQGPSLGAKVLAYNEAGQPVVNEVGELVIAEPMPSMPLHFWGDPEMERYRASYFEMFPGVWRHGDWISFNERGGCVIYGRSDSTINRQGIRMGTSEIYRVVESFPEITDSLVIDLELLGRESYMALFVVLREGEELTGDLVERVKQRLRQEVSPRHIPDETIAIPEVPYTLSGKKMEVPVRKILLGMDPGQAAKRGAMRNPAAIDFFVEFAQKLATK